MGHVQDPDTLKCLAHEESPYLYMVWFMVPGA
jgi:hypothetical protein